MEAMAASRKAVPLEVARVDDRTIPGPAGEIPVRIYTPPGGGVRPAIVYYYHGGGHVIGLLGLARPDRRAQSVRRGRGGRRVGRLHRMGPEHRFPARGRRFVFRARLGACQRRQHRRRPDPARRARRQRRRQPRRGRGPDGARPRRAGAAAAIARLPGRRFPHGDRQLEQDLCTTGCGVTAHRRGDAVVSHAII